MKLKGYLARLTYYGHFLPNLLTALSPFYNYLDMMYVGLDLQIEESTQNDREVIYSLSGVPATSIREARLVLAPEVTRANS